jgi:succinoglycan biosynthesis transport protein ExoP
VERLIEQDLEITALRGKHADLDSQYRSETANTGRVAKNSAFNPALRTLRSELDLAKKQLEKKRKALRPAVIRRLQNPESDPSINKAGGVKQQMAIVEELEANLKDEIEHLSKMDQALTDDTLDLQDMQDDVKQLQEASSKIASEVEKLNVELQAPPRITLVEEAAPPTTRDSKKWFMMFGAITLGSFLATLLGVAFLELQTRKVDSADEVVADLGLPVVGSLPMLPTRSRRNGVLTHHEKDRYWYNLLLESIDATRTMLIHAAESGSYRVVMITSALSGEGKTSLASHLATSLARSGKKTLLIDADLRSPSIHRLFDLTPEPGLSELLRGETALEDAVASTAIQELKVITAGKVDHLTLRILSQGGMGSLFARLKEQFDFVIVDTSPILPVADGLIIAQQADAVLFSILTDVSRKTKIFAAYQRLTTLGARVLGAVVTGAHDGVYGTNYYPGQVPQETAERAETTTEPEPEAAS